MIKQMISKTKEMNRIMLRFSGLEFLFWATCSAYYSFSIVYLNDRGFSTTAIGTIVAVNSFIIIFAQPFWGMVSDWLQSVKKVFIFCLGVSALMLLFVPLLHWVVWVGIFLALITFFESAMVPLLDSWVISGIKNDRNIAYGSIRLWGSIGFAVIAFLLGKVIDKTSVSIIFPAYSIMALLTILIASRIKIDKPVHVVPLRDLKVGKLLKNYAYVTYLLFAIILFIPHRASFIFLPLLMESVGGSREQFGLALSVMAVCEVPIFLMAKHIFKVFKPLHLIILSSVFFIARQVIFSIATAPVHIILNQTLQGLGYGLFLMGSVYYIDSLAPDSLKSTAQTLATAIFFGVSGIIGSFGGGWFIDNFGLHTMYQAGILINIGNVLFFLFSIHIGKKIIGKKMVSSM